MRKKIIFILITLLMMYSFVELLSSCTSYLLSGRKFFSSRRYDKEIEKVIEAKKDPCQEPVLPPWLDHNGDGESIVHPYVGYVNNHKKRNATEFGFADSKHPLQKREGNKVIIGIFGGSAAEFFYLFGKDALEQELRAYPEFKDKDIIILNLAIGGFKQPQQLMTLNYILSLGGDLDMVINVDGFNEVVLPIIDNLPNKVCPWFPARWDLKVRYNTILKRDILILSEIYNLMDKQKNMASFFSDGFLRYSPTAKLLNDYLYSYHQQLISQKRADLFKVQEVKEYALLPYGPSSEYKSEEELFLSLVSIWSRCSWLMFNACRDNKIRYFHFLQPCQYVPGTKPMGSEELSVAFDEHARQRPAVLKGYPLLIKEGSNLAGKGICFTDLTGVFSETKELVYIDNFCHFGTLGSQIMAKKIVEVIVNTKKSK